MNIKPSNFTFSLLLALALLAASCTKEAPLKVAYFQADVTPPLGVPVAYAPTRSITDSLSARGVVLLPANQEPIVLCSVDWLLISNESMDQFKSYLAKAAGTSPERVSIHTVHQHDTPWCDITSENILADYGMGGIRFDTLFLAKCMKATADALTSAVGVSREVAAIGFGQAEVEKVASNRRILGDDGKVKIVRFSSAKDSAAINAPEGLIDPFLKTVSFWDSDSIPIVVLNYYATHPQSFYGQGDVNPEFIGLARNQIHKKTGIPQVFFIGAAGNIAAGKYNNGTPEMRPVLTQRIAEGMEKAFRATTRQSVPETLKWRSSPFKLPLAGHLVADSLKIQLADTTKNFTARFVAARQLAWLNRNQDNKSPLAVSSLQLGDIWLLHLPGEPFIEYQLAAQQHKSNDRVCTAAYSEGGIIYIGTATSYSQGGYEVDPRVNMTTSEADAILTSAIREVLP